jgi:DNA recombination protein RmuC
MPVIVLLVTVLAAAACVAAGYAVGTARTRQQEERRRGELASALAAGEATLVAERAASAARLTAEREASAAQLALVRDEREQLQAQFEQLSQEVVRRNSAQFFEQFQALADEKLKASEARSAAELDQRRQAVEHLVKPLTDSLTQVQKQLQEVEKDRAGAYAELRQQVTTMNETSQQLRTETAALVTALRAPQVRGRWGEMQLRRVVESSGMVEHCDFVEQATAASAEGDPTLRPDLVVKLAGGKNVVVDAKVSFSGYLEAMEAKDDTSRSERLKAHARHLRKHVDDLAAKSYWQRFEPTPEFVVMFVPAEVFLNAALDQDPALLEYAFERNVVIATPQTLIALLRTIGYAWRQESLAANAKAVYQLGRDLHGRLATMGGHLTKLGTQLGGAVRAYNESIGSLESRVLVTARRLTELKVSDEELLTPAPLEVVARLPQAAELVASAQDALVVLEPGRDGGTLVDPIEIDQRFGVTPPRPAPDAGDAAADA